MRIRSSLILCLLLLVPGMAQSQTTPVEGLRDNTPAVHALTGARIVVAPGKVLEDATLVVRDGVIEAVGTGVRVPADARVWDVRGQTLYPGFIDAYADLGMPGEAPEADERGAVSWNRQLRSFVDAGAVLGDAAKDVAALRGQGVGVAHVVPRVGIFRGQTALVGLGAGAVRERMIRDGVAQAAALTRDRRLGMGYPTSAMGGVSFIRQTLHDADWYGRAHATYARNPEGVRRPETNEALASLVDAVRGAQPLLLEATDEEEVLRALRFADEFPVSLWIRGSGHEYRILDAIAAAGVPLILPVAYPEAPDVDTPEDALNVSLAELRHWYLAPENPARLARAGVDFAFTADGLEDRKQFLPNVRKAVERGLSTEAALAALTTTPARMLGIERTHGTLERGKVANVVVVEGDLFDDDAVVREVWVDGTRFEVDPAPAVDPRGRWMIATTDGALRGELQLEGTPKRLSGTFVAGGREVRLTAARYGDAARRLHLAFPGEALGADGVVRLTANISGDALSGWGELPDGSRLDWRGERTEVVAKAAPSAKANAKAAPLALAEITPAMEYGRPEIPAQPEHLLIRNATVWTMGPQGILEGADVRVRRGKIVEVGHGLDAPRGATVIDAAGRHVTPGLIDAHLHSGVTGGVNETGSAIVPEVRIGDVLTMNNIWMYRQLAGGLTTAHVMHGSANPIGGQNQHIKLRWGATPEELKFEGAPRTVKFALGENPKRRSNRYPDTRMGTEQIIRDHFKAARDYQRAWREWEKKKDGIPPRRDLRLEAIAEILDGEILIMSHSYRQDEILMLMRLAEEFDFRIHAFHHTVEAYKVAPELARHGAGAVVWSDWSSFKIEAYDGTTYNARVLTDAGVLTSLHSDNSQIASRMNWEAAKMLRTGMDEEAALALVTSNTAKILGIDDRVGSLEVGKDADFVIWSGHPLSSSTRAEETWIDGRKYFDIDEDRQMREAIERERAQLVQLILDQR